MIGKFYCIRYAHVVKEIDFSFRYKSFRSDMRLGSETDGLQTTVGRLSSK